MGSLKRKIARNRAKREKKEFEKVMKKQLMMFDKIGVECAMCKKSFDRKSKEDAMTWKVVVREKEEKVRLYCPSCWDEANKLIKEIQNDFRIQNGTRGKATESSKPE